MSPSEKKTACQLLTGCFSITDAPREWNFGGTVAVLQQDNLVFADYLQDCGESEMSEGARLLAKQDYHEYFAQMWPDYIYVVLNYIPFHLQSMYVTYSHNYDHRRFQVAFKTVEDAIWCFCYVYKQYQEVDFPSCSQNI